MEVGIFWVVVGGGANILGGGGFIWGSGGW